MKLPTYHAAQVTWDEFRRFHNKHREYMAVFETHEALLFWTRLSPDARSASRDHIHPNCSLRIAMSSDSDCPKFHFNDEALTPSVVDALQEAGQDVDKLRAKPIPSAWLTQGGGQYLLLDSEGGRTVGYGRRTAATQSAGWEYAPTWLTADHRRAVAAYIPGNGAKALGRKISVSVPVIPPLEVRRARLELLAQCKAWLSLVTQGYSQIAPKYYETEGNSRRYKYIRPMEAKDLPYGEFTKMADLSAERRIQLAEHGFAAERTHIRVESLTATFN